MTTAVGPAGDPDGAVRKLADDYLADRAEVDPEAAAALGRTDGSALPDLTPEGFAARTAVDREALTRLELLGSAARSDPLGVALRERLTADIDLYDCGFTTTLLAPLATEVHRLRQVFDDLPRENEADWERVAAHLEAGARGYGDYAATLIASLDRGHRVQRRQVLLVAGQCRSWIDPPGPGFYRSLVAGYPGGALAARLEAAANEITAATDRFATFLTDSLAGRADVTDGAGPERYRITSQAFLGAEIDPAELYDYGWSELHRLTDAARRLARRLTGDTDLRAARRALDNRPGATVAAGDELVAWLQSRLDGVTEQLSGSHFDLPDNTPVQARMVTAGSGVMYYAPADPAGTRPGRVWWSVPPGTTRVPTWREVSTVHHEGLPGHHLQFAVTQGIEDLHPWQRYLCHVHGYAEGWAHYAEQLAVDVGLLHDDAELLGVYGAQLWRAARIVIDLGLHLGYPIPPGTPLTEQRSWHPGMAAEFLSEVAGTDPATAGYEVDRYLGWPGQALAFKVGAKLWTQARTEQQGRLGPRFDLKEFHMTALRLGPMGLDPLRQALGRWGEAA
jgi:uncharacterized protein (DUF885 family)